MAECDAAIESKTQRDERASPASAASVKPPPVTGSMSVESSRIPLTDCLHGFCSPRANLTEKNPHWLARIPSGKGYSLPGRTGIQSAQEEEDSSFVFFLLFIHFFFLCPATPVPSTRFQLKPTRKREKLSMIMTANPQRSNKNRNRQRCLLTVTPNAWKSKPPTWQ